MNMDDSAASSIAEQPLSLSILSSIAEEPLALSLSTDDEKFEGGVTRIPELEDGIFEPLFSTTPGKRQRVSYEHGSYNLEKVLNFGSRLEKSLNLVKSLKST